MYYWLVYSYQKLAPSPFRLICRLEVHLKNEPTVPTHFARSYPKQLYRYKVTFFRVALLRTLNPWITCNPLSYELLLPARLYEYLDRAPLPILPCRCYLTQFLDSHSLPHLSRIFIRYIEVPSPVAGYLRRRVNKDTSLPRRASLRRRRRGPRVAALLARLLSRPVTSQRNPLSARRVAVRLLVHSCSYGIILLFASSFFHYYSATLNFPHLVSWHYPTDVRLLGLGLSTFYERLVDVLLAFYVVTYTLPT